MVLDSTYVVKSSYTLTRMNSATTHRLLIVILSLFLLGWGEVKIPGTENPAGDKDGLPYYKWYDAKVLTDAKVNGLRVMRVRAKSQFFCKAGYRDGLALQGIINDDSTFLVKTLLEKIKEDGRCVPKSAKSGEPHYYATPVYLDSDGGYVKDGYDLGRLFRKEQVKTIITNNQTCASSCAAAFLGGVHRTMVADTSRLMFHSPYKKSGWKIECAGWFSSRGMESYFVEMLGEEKGERLYDKAMSYCSASNGWTLNKDAADLFGLTTTGK